MDITIFSIKKSQKTKKQKNRKKQPNRYFIFITV